MQYEGKEFGTCGVQGVASSDETDSVESHDEEMVVEASLNIDDVERAALKAINGEVYNIADHVHSGNAEESLSGYWVQALPPAPRGQGSTSCGCCHCVRAFNDHAEINMLFPSYVNTPTRASSSGRLDDVPGV